VGIEHGSPESQVRQFLDAAYLPLKWQWQFHAAAREADLPGGPVDIGVGGARGPGKSHAVLSQAAIDDCQRYPGLKVLFLRKTGVAAQESFDDLVSKVLRGHMEFRKTLSSLRLKNGSRIILGGFKDEKDIDKYIGIEYDVIIVEELNQISEERYNKLRGSLRTSKPGWRPRMYTSFNPGGTGHAFVKNRYVIPERMGTQKETRFIPSTYKLNPHTNVEYNQYLEGLSGDLGRAWREGDFDLFEGQYFDEWRHQKHVVEAFTMPDTWKRFRSIDPSGRNGITSCHWYALDSDGNVWVYREYYYGVGVPLPDGTKVLTGRDYDEHADQIHRLSCDRDGIEEEYMYTVIDTAAFAKAGYSETCAEVYERHGVRGLIPAAKERLVGWNGVHFYLRHDESTPPRLRVFRNCANMIRTIPLLQHDALHPEDVDTTGEDHAADELRYILRTFKEQAAPKAENKVERRLRELRRQEHEESFNYMRGS